jgi:hypothetical protein
MRQFREVSLKPEREIPGRPSLENKNIEIIHYIFTFYSQNLTCYFIS